MGNKRNRQEGDFERGKKKKERKTRGGKGQPPIWLDGLAGDEDARHPPCLQEKSALNRQSRADKGGVSGDLMSTFFSHLIKTPTHLPTRELNLLTLHTNRCIARMPGQVPPTEPNTNLFELKLSFFFFCSETCLFLLFHAAWCGYTLRALTGERGAREPFPS